MKSIRIYLSGSIKKGEKDASQLYWTESDEEFIKKNIKDCRVELLNPATANIRRSDPFSNFGADLYLVTSSDFLMADLREGRGIGVGCEMTIAKFFKIPVISICPCESHYRKSKLHVYGEELQNWIHPMVEGLSDIVVENLSEAVAWVNGFLASPKAVKDSKLFQEAIEYYKKTQVIQENNQR